MDSHSSQTDSSQTDSGQIEVSNQSGDPGVNQQEQFVQLLTQHQNRIRAYIFSLVANHSTSADILQETNLVLWRKIAEYDPQRSFLTWAFGIARMQVLAHLRDRKRDRVVLDEELVQMMGQDAEKSVNQLEQIHSALKLCLQQLTSQSRNLIENRYFEAMPLAQVAEVNGKTLGAMKVALMRVRKQLGLCIQNRLASDS